MPLIAKLIRVSGNVQGVFFRAWTKQQADELGISGWVRNRPDGSVEALVAGEAQVVSSIIDRMRRGPPAATVERLIEEPTEDAPDAGFVVRH